MNTETDGATYTLTEFHLVHDCGTARALVVPPPNSTTGVRDCGGNSYTPPGFQLALDCGSAGLREQ